MANRETESAPQSPITRLLKLFISLGFFVATSCWDFFRSLIGGTPDGACIILYYHSIAPEHRSGFARQMDHLLRWASPISIDALEPLAGNVRHAAVTFDDGYESVAEQALPELARRNIPATIFVPSALVGKKPGWDGYPERCMSAEQLRALPVHLITLGSHTETHPYLPKLNEVDARREIDESKRTLEEMLDRKITLFSFPYGGFNAQTVAVCRDAGYQRVFTTVPILARLGPDEFVSGRVSVEPNDWPIEFHLKLMGAYRWLPFAFALKRKCREMFGRGQAAQKAPNSSLA
jgi:peptidoglycan/xylan/chitin deacetylase (PgdA/CDA1 family)